jgi:hypothetical protein
VGVAVSAAHSYFAALCDSLGSYVIPEGLALTAAKVVVPCWHVGIHEYWGRTGLSPPTRRRAEIPVQGVTVCVERTYDLAAP